MRARVPLERLGLGRRLATGAARPRTTCTSRPPATDPAASRCGAASLRRMDAIVVDGLEKTYGRDVRALDGMTFAVPEGQVFGLLGPNGAGKSTTVRILVTLTRPDAGRAEVAGRDVVQEPAAVRRAIGYVPQASGVDREATGRENLRLQGVPRREVERRTDELLELFGLAEKANALVRTYSGGQKRRLDVAMGLVH